MLCGDVLTKMTFTDSMKATCSISGETLLHLKNTHMIGVIALQML